MSIKQTPFNVFVPQSVSKYLVLIPGMIQTSFLCEATTYPTAKYGEVSIPFKGHTIVRPTVRMVDGDWSCTVSENEFMSVRREILTKELSHFVAPNTFNIQIFPLGYGGVLPSFGVTLHDAWLKGRNPVSLGYSDVTTIWKWELEFKFNRISERIFDAGKVGEFIGGLTSVFK